MDVRRRMFFLKKASSGGGSTTGGSYTINLNDQWRKSSTVPNPNSNSYDGVYESYSNYNVDSGVAIMYIDIVGYTNFKLYIRSYAESNYDYVMVSQLDQTITGSTSYNNTTLVKAHTRGNQQSGTILSSYTLVEYTGITSGEHTITIVYRKDSSYNNGDDRGYVLIPKSQGSGEDSEGGDVNIDTTYSILYTSTDGNTVNPYYTTVFGANIVLNTYINGQGIITFDASVTKIGNYAFMSRSKLTSITIPDSVTSIGNQAFYNCDSLTSITIGDGVTSIGERAFWGCDSLTTFNGKFASADNRCLIIDGVLNSFAPAGLTSYTIPNSVITIGVYAFASCQSLTSVTIPNSVTDIRERAFHNCGFTSITIPNSVTSIGNSAFNNCYNLKRITIPDSVTYIGDLAFYYCYRLTSVTISNSVTSIGSQAFSDCENLTEFKGKFASNDGRCLIIDGVLHSFAPSGLSEYTIPDSVTSIGEYAFRQCKSLASITIPNSVTSIKDNAFYNCTRLTSVYCKPTTPPTGNSDMFYQYTSDCKIYVPTASVDAYKAAEYWSDYADYIVGYDF